MTKKFLIPTLITLASLLGSLSSISPANAEKLDINGTDYWTIDEVTKTGQKFTDDLKMCDNNRECEDYLEVAYILAENEYSAGQAFMNNYFLISAINPATSTIRVVFHDEANKRMMRDDSGKDIMKNLFLYWQDGDQARWIYGFDDPEYETNYQDIFAYLGKPGEKWLEPNKEVEIKVPDFDFSHLKTSRIFFYVRSEKSNAAGNRDLSECINTIENLNGYECQAVFDWLGNINYQPFKAKEEAHTKESPDPATDDVASTKPTAPASITKNSTNDIGVPEPTSVEKTISTNKAGVPISTIGTREKNVKTNTEPNEIAVQSAELTQAKTEPEKSTQDPSDTIALPLAAGKGEEEHQFPWWLVVFGFSGVFLIIWWLIPSKKSKKTLDKQ